MIRQLERFLSIQSLDMHVHPLRMADHITTGH